MISARRLLVLLVAISLGPVPLRAQVASAWADCRSDSLSTYNCARYYSGTVSVTSEIKGTGINQNNSVVATITQGRVSCRMKGTETPEFEGPGMLAVEHTTTGTAGEYAISVWCPDAPGERPDRGDDPIITIMKQRAADYALLAGKDAHESPDADAANGISGTETMTWSLRRQ